MTTKKKKQVKTLKNKVETPVVEVEEAVVEETPPQIHAYQVRRRVQVGSTGAVMTPRIGSITYYESSGEVEYSFEVGHESYMKSFVGRSVFVLNDKGKQIGIPRSSTRKWVDNLSNSILPDDYYCELIGIRPEKG